MGEGGGIGLVDGEELFFRIEIWISVEKFGLDFRILSFKCSFFKKCRRKREEGEEEC